MAKEGFLNNSSAIRGIYYVPDIQKYESMFYSETDILKDALLMFTCFQASEKRGKLHLHTYITKIVKVTSDLLLLYCYKQLPAWNAPPSAQYWRKKTLHLRRFLGNALLIREPIRSIIPGTYNLFDFSRSFRGFSRSSR